MYPLYRAGRKWPKARFYWSAGTRGTIRLKTDGDGMNEGSMRNLKIKLSSGLVSCVAKETAMEATGEVIMYSSTKELAYTERFLNHQDDKDLTLMKVTCTLHKYCGCGTTHICGMKVWSKRFCYFFSYFKYEGIWRAHPFQVRFCVWYSSMLTQKQWISSQFIFFTCSGTRPFL